MKRVLFILCGAGIGVVAALLFVANSPALSKDDSAYAVLGVLGIVTGMGLGFIIHLIFFRTSVEREADAYAQEHGIAESVGKVSHGRGSLIAGIAACAVAVIWFVVGFAGDRIYFYPPILLLMGIVSIIRSIGSRS